MIVPFDKTEPVYQQMLSDLRRHLRENSMPVKLYDLVEALIKLQVDDSAGIRGMIRDRVMEGRWSRNAYDVAMCLHWFGSMYRLWKNDKDLKAYAKVFQDLKYMQVEDLRS